MSECDVCGQQENMPYQCGHCGGTYCGEHRLPESHDCPGLDNWNDPKGVFDSGFDDSVDGGDSSGSGGFSIDTGPGSVFGYFRGNMTYVFLATMAITFVLQHIVLLTAPRLHQVLFVIHPERLPLVWTWVTSIFSHAPFSFSHILLNGVVIFFFGRLAERQMGSKKFTLFFIGSGVLSGLGQAGLQLLQGGPVQGALGASGAALAILGFVTVINPDLTVYVYFLLPVPVWVITGLYTIISIAGIVAPGTGMLSGNIGHAAHLGGLIIGLWYGKRIKDQSHIPNQVQFGGRRGGGPGGRGPF